MFYCCSYFLKLSAYFFSYLNFFFINIFSLHFVIWHSNTSFFFFYLYFLSNVYENSCITVVYAIRKPIKFQIHHPHLKCCLQFSIGHVHNLLKMTTGILSLSEYRNHYSWKHREWNPCCSFKAVQNGHRRIGLDRSVW